MRPILRMKALIAAGLDTLSADGDIGAEWTEAARSFVVDVPKLEIGGLAESIRAGRARQRAAAGIFGQRGRRRSARRRRSRPARSNSRCAIWAASISGSPNTPAPRTSAARPRGKRSLKSIRDQQQRTCSRQSGCDAAVQRWPALSRPRANADHQADAARQGAGDAAFPAVEDRPADRAGAIPDRGFDGAVS